LSQDIDLALQRESKALDADREMLKQAEQRLAVLNQGITPKREAHSRYAAEHNKAEVQFAKLESRLQFLVEACQKAHECMPQDIDWRAELWFAGDAVPERIRVDIEEETPEELDSALVRPEPGDEDLRQMEAAAVWQEIADEITSLRQREQAIGPVNLAAIDEYKELKQRHDFLSAQSSDLWNAKEALLKAIDEINRTSQEMFADTFASIRNNFHFTFDKLFGGGRADLQLVDDGDVLESGIDITAQPPGTRLSSIGLLSGGQKTMTAVALLFAIYMVKPSPFCVLDEIDAPLDDANIGRFTDMLEGFLEFSQFLIITHNKRTIRVADTIYGATMQEKGVTRMVSMRFNRNTGNAEIAQ
jgi:chromosome segregation protein